MLNLLYPSPPVSFPTPCRSPGGGGVGDRHLVNPKFFVAAHCVVVWVGVLWGTTTCIPCTHGRTFCSLLLKWNLTTQPCFPLGPRNFTPSRSRSRSPYIGSPLNASYAECFRFMLQFLCLQMCMYGWGVVPQGGVGDRHLVTIPQGVVGDRLPWGEERHGGPRVHGCAQ